LSCLTVIPLAPGKNPFAVQLSNNNNNSIQFSLFMCKTYQPQANYKVSKVVQRSRRRRRRRRELES
jgi:hypothetical protein